MQIELAKIIRALQNVNLDSATQAQILTDIMARRSKLRPDVNVVEPFRSSHQFTGATHMFGNMQPQIRSVKVDPKYLTVGIILPGSFRVHTVENVDQLLRLTNKPTLEWSMAETFLTQNPGYGLTVSSHSEDSISKAQAYRELVSLNTLFVMGPPMRAFEYSRYKWFSDFFKDTKSIFISGISDETPPEGIAVGIKESNIVNRNMALYYPNPKVKVGTKITEHQIEPLVIGVILKALAKGRYVPAGKKYGELPLDQMLQRVTESDRELLYTVGVNPILAQPQSSPSIWGDKTISGTYLSEILIKILGKNVEVYY